MTLRPPPGPCVAVIGCGYWGAKHVRVLSSLASVARVVAVDADERRLRALDGTVPGIATFSSVHDAIPHVDAAIIATPPTTHVPLGLQLIAAGKHVMVEKPLATSVDGARQLISAADRAGVVLMVGHTFEYHAAVWKLREMVRSKEVGELYYVDTARLNLGLYQRDVNVVDDLAPHDVSIVNYILDRHPVAVDAWGSRNAHRRFEDVAYVRLHYTDPEVFANIHVSWLDPHKVRRVTVVGSKKMVVYNDLSEERIRVHDKGVQQEPSTSDDILPPMSYRYGDVVAPYLSVDEPLVVEDNHFLDCVRDGTKPATDGANGLAVVEVLQCAQISMAEGRTVRLSEVQFHGDRTHLTTTASLSATAGPDVVVPLGMSGE
jgi:predicted dehydrogenase